MNPFLEFNEICKNCGLTYGSHLGTATSVYPKDYCPGNEGCMNWSHGPGTKFKSTGFFADPIYNSPAVGRKE